MDGPGEAVAFRLWPPVALGAPLLVGWPAALLWGDPGACWSTLRQRESVPRA